MSYLQDIISSIEQTHKGLGKLSAVCALAAKAKKAVLIVSPSGCGKSAAMEWVVDGYPDSLKMMRLSAAGLAKRADELTDFNSVIMVDDIATVQTDYARIASITTLTALCYTHYINSSMGGLDNAYDIQNFYGAALIGIQPVILRSVMQSPEWDGSIQDKCLRYYHLYRPETPNFNKPEIAPSNGVPVDDVKDFEPDIKNIHWQRLGQLALMQWGRARAKQHLMDYLKAAAALDNRINVIDKDIEELEELFRPMAYEPLVVVKEQLEGDRKLDNNLLALLTEYYSYGGKFQIGHIAMDYKIQATQAYKIMRQQDIYWEQISKSPTVYKPTKALLQQLRKYRLEIVTDENQQVEMDL